MEKYRNFSLFIILIPTPDFPHFYYILGGNLGSLLYGDVSVMGYVAVGIVHTQNNVKKLYMYSSIFPGYGPMKIFSMSFKI